MRNFSDTLKDKAYLLTLIIILASGAHLALGAQTADSSGWHTAAGQVSSTGQSADESGSFISADVIETRMFRLVDDSGAERATMTVGSDGPVLTMYSKNRSSFIELQAKDDGSLLINMRGVNSTGNLRLSVDADTMPALSLDQLDKGYVELAIAKDRSGLTISHPVMETGIMLSIDDSKNSSLNLFTSNGSRVGLYASPTSALLSADCQKPLQDGNENYAGSSYSVGTGPEGCGMSMMSYTKETSSFINAMCIGPGAGLQCKAYEGDQKEPFECDLHSWAGLQSALVTTDEQGKHTWPVPCED